jgi:hypothetical protein
LSRIFSYFLDIIIVQLSHKDKTPWKLNQKKKNENEEQNIKIFSENYAQFSLGLPSDGF